MGWLVSMSTLREEQGKSTRQPAAPGDCSEGIIETLQFASPLQHQPPTVSIEYRAAELRAGGVEEAQAASEA